MKCSKCGNIFKTSGALKYHEWRMHTEDGLKLKPCKGKHPWNFGKDKITDVRLYEWGQRLSKRVKSGELVYPKRNVTEETKRLLSEKLKLAHKEGRANNWQDSKKFNNMSYPETFFVKVIENDFEDKNYTFQYRFGKFAIDFAWVDRKIAIEIDGEQHQRLEQQIKNDIEKNELLKLNGWKLLRIKWKDMYHDTKTWINIAKKFIDMPLKVK